MADEHEIGRRLMEAFWAAVEARDAATAGSPEREAAERRVERLAELMSDYDTQGKVPTDEDLADAGA